MSFFLLAVIYLAFVSLGLPDSVLGVAWPSMRSGFAAPLEGAGLIAVILTTCSAVSSVFSGPVNARFGTGRVVLISSALTAAGLMGYSLAPSYWWVLVAALPLGFGQGAVDSSLNGYVASHYSSRHMNWLHASWGIGATAGPVIMTALMAGGPGWRSGYRAISLVQASLALLFALTLGLWNGRGVKADDGAHGHVPGSGGAPGSRTRIRGLARAEPWVQISMYLLYAACEFTVGIWTVSMLIESRGVDPSVAGFWISLYYGGITAGRVLTGTVADRLGNRFMVRSGLALALVGAVLLGIRANPYLALPGLLLLGLGFAPVYPCLMHETPRRFDEDTYRTVIGFQVAAACLGASVLPGFVGLAASRASLEILAPCVLGFIVALLALGEWLNRRT